MTEKAIQWLSTQAPQMEQLLRELVECSSCTTDPAGVNAADEILRGATLGACEVIPSQEFGSHFIFHGKKRAVDQGVTLVGHMATVFPKIEFHGYSSTGNIARGPGVLDIARREVSASMSRRWEFRHRAVPPQKGRPS